MVTKMQTSKKNTIHGQTTKLKKDTIKKLQLKVYNTYGPTFSSFVMFRKIGF